jgi:hypothetical protein
MKIFVLGSSHSGKTPLAEAIARNLQLPVFGAGEWVRGKIGAAAVDMADYIARATERSVEILRRDFSFSLRSISDAMKDSPSCVIDGERNPYDFIRLFDPATDLTVSLTHNLGNSRNSAYESGLLVILSYLDWLGRNAFISTGQDRRYDFKFLRSSEGPLAKSQSLESNMEAIVHRLKADILDGSARR